MPSTRRAPVDNRPLYYALRRSRRRPKAPLNESSAISAINGSSLAVFGIRRGVGSGGGVLLAAGGVCAGTGAATPVVPVGASVVEAGGSRKDAITISAGNFAFV